MPVPSDVVTVDLPSSVDPSLGATTPMAQRVAVLGLLNKRNGLARDLTLKPGQAARGRRRHRPVARLASRPRHGSRNIYTGAFAQVDVEQVDHSWRRVFFGLGSQGAPVAQRRPAHGL